MPDKPPMQWTILLFSSEPVARLVMQEVLERAGYVVLATGDLGDAVDRLQECRPDLLLIHPYVDMMSGHDAAKYLHTRCPAMKILMIAGLLEDDRLRYRAELESVEIFPKPITAAELVDKVHLVLSAPTGQVQSTMTIG
jgi:CheY-like chemotaxis protein